MNTNLHFNPLPPYGGRPAESWEKCELECISIHSLRMEGDGIEQISAYHKSISIHSLRMEGDIVL